MSTEWKRDTMCAQVLWRAHKEDPETLARPYQDLHVAAHDLRERFRALYDQDAHRMGINRAKVSGDGHVLMPEDRRRVEQALDHLGARRIWSLRTACNDEQNVRPGSVAALLLRFPRLKDSLAAVAETWLSPVYENSGLAWDELEEASVLPAALQLRVGAVDPAHQEEFMEYLQFVHAVSRQWLAGARDGACHPLDFDSIQEHVHQTLGGKSARQIQYARQLVRAQLLQLIDMEECGDEITLSMAIPSYLNLRVSAPSRSPADPAWIAEQEGSAHPVHFQLPAARCPRIRVSAHLEASRLHIDDIEPYSTPPPIEEPESWGVVGWALACGAAMARAALQCMWEEGHHARLLSAVLATCGGMAAGMWTGVCFVSQWRARQASQLHCAWQLEQSDDKDDSDEDDENETRSKSKSV